MIELIIVVLIASVLATIAIPQYSRYTSRKSATTARDAFISIATRARAEAIRTGDDVFMEVNPATHRVDVFNTAGTVEETLDLQNGPIRARILGNFILDVRYTSRGFVHPATTILGGDVIFTSVTGRDSALARITVGQVERR
jgi:type II secretory pathway pseudopilin PulG